MNEGNKIWPTKKLGDLSECLDNKRIPISKENRENGNIPYYGATGQVDSIKEYLFDEELLLVGEDGADWSAGANTSYIINGKSWVNNHAHVLRINKINIVYLKEYLNHADLKQYVSGSTRGKLNKSDLLNIEIPIPSNDEQIKIADILSNTDKAIEKTDKIIHKSEELKNGIIQNLIDFKHDKWTKRKFEDVTTFIDYRGKTPKKTDEGIPLITAKNVRMGYVDENPREYINPDDYDTWMTRGIPKKGDVLFTTEAPLGNIAQLQTADKVAFAQRVIIIQTKTNLLPSFLKYYLMSKKMQLKIASLGTGGTVKGIKAKVLKQIQISIPRMEEQTKIVDVLQALDMKIDNDKKTKMKLQIEKNGIMQNIFRIND